MPRSNSDRMRQTALWPVIDRIQRRNEIILPRNVRLLGIRSMTSNPALRQLRPKTKTNVMGPMNQGAQRALSVTEDRQPQPNQLMRAISMKGCGSNHKVDRPRRHRRPIQVAMTLACSMPDRQHPGAMEIFPLPWTRASSFRKFLETKRRQHRQNCRDQKRSLLLTTLLEDLHVLCLALSAPIQGNQMTYSHRSHRQNKRPYFLLLQSIHLARVRNLEYGKICPPILPVQYLHRPPTRC